jgi:hypothetical protein
MICSPPNKSAKRGLSAAVKLLPCDHGSISATVKLLSRDHEVLILDFRNSLIQKYRKVLHA